MAPIMETLLPNRPRFIIFLRKHSEAWCFGIMLLLLFASAIAAAATPLSGLISKSGNTVSGNGSTNFSNDFKIGDFVATSQGGATMSLITSVGASTLTTAEVNNYGNTAYYRGATLRITASPGLVIEQGSTLTVTLSNAPLLFPSYPALRDLYKAIFHFHPPAHRPAASFRFTAGGLLVDSASVITNGSFVRGNVFSTNAVATNNNIVFAKGSRYVHNPKNANPAENQVPFGSTVTGPQSVIDLQPGSTIVYSTNNGASFAGFKYGDVVINGNITATTSPPGLKTLR